MSETIRGGGVAVKLRIHVSENGDAMIDGIHVPISIWDDALDDSEGAPGEQEIEESRLPEGWRDAYANGMRP